VKLSVHLNIHWLKIENGDIDVFLLFNPGYTLPIYIIYLKYITSLIHSNLGEGIEGIEGLIRSRRQKTIFLFDLNQKIKLVQIALYLKININFKIDLDVQYLHLSKFVLNKYINPWITKIIINI